VAGIASEVASMTSRDQSARTFYRIATVGLVAALLILSFVVISQQNALSAFPKTVVLSETTTSTLTTPAITTINVAIATVTYSVSSEMVMTCTPNLGICTSGTRTFVATTSYATTITTTIYSQTQTVSETVTVTTTATKAP
jgi:hypothetical protein